jgi:hypothetical protein
MAHVIFTRERDTCVWLVHEINELRTLNEVLYYPRFLPNYNASWKSMKEILLTKIHYEEQVSEGCLDQISLSDTKSLVACYYHQYWKWVTCFSSLENLLP